MCMYDQNHDCLLLNGSLSTPETTPEIVSEHLHELILEVHLHVVLVAAWVSLFSVRQFFALSHHQLEKRWFLVVVAAIPPGLLPFPGKSALLEQVTHDLVPETPALEADDNR